MMKKLHEIVKERTELQKDLKTLREGFEKNEKLLVQKINELRRLELLGTNVENNLNLDKIQLAESVIYFEGDPTGKNLNGRAINKLANDPSYLQKNYIGNKRYEAFYQENDSEYGYGPRHGYIVDRIGLRPKARTEGLTSDEKDACIYYLTNIEKIKELSNEKVSG